LLAWNSCERRLSAMKGDAAYAWERECASMDDSVTRSHRVRL